MEDFGRDRMQTEVELLNDRIKQLHDECVDRLVPLQNLDREFRDWIPPGIQLQGYRLKPNSSEICYRNALSPMAFAIDIEERQCQDASILRGLSKLDKREKVPCMWQDVPISYF